MPFLKLLPSLASKNLRPAGTSGLLRIASVLRLIVVAARDSFALVRAFTVAFVALCLRPHLDLLVGCFQLPASRAASMACIRDVAHTRRGSSPSRKAK